MYCVQCGVRTLDKPDGTPVEMCKKCTEGEQSQSHDSLRSKYSLKFRLAIGFHALYAIIWLIWGIVSGFQAAIDGIMNIETNNFSMVLLAVLMIVLHLTAGYGLLIRHPWAEKATMLFGCILFFFYPWGTVAGSTLIYSLIQLRYDYTLTSKFFRKLYR
ncbi:hypothetical protein L6J37_12490 [Photobacterium sp. WH77]|uniref:hypothetical protein n=1 Tax=Photobacterium TaxID=657 RepID=UPI001C46CD97|nr:MULTISPECIES: hypothetical protein [Photobacterium]MBV7263072.1 hypothetical protein [Photobacterium sp. WH24]MCG2837649.1 hypothetical protein [Photobacterium sp. WH77]MCG2845265.1 hypothetical protein [Photobacterium sp. WH80]MDO6583064.1 hypothetical protein [Photobacterium sp. 2_MG-2023]